MAEEKLQLQKKLSNKSITSITSNTGITRKKSKTITNVIINTLIGDNISDNLFFIFSSIKVYNIQI